MRRLAWLLLLLLIAAAAAYGWIVAAPLPLPQPAYAFTVKPGASLRSVARELAAAGVLPADWILVGWARITGRTGRSRPEITSSPRERRSPRLLAKLTQGDVTQTAFTIVEGWSIRDLRSALKKHPGIVPAVANLPDAGVDAKTRRH